MSEETRRARRKKRKQRERLGLFLCVVVIAILAIVIAVIAKGCSADKPAKNGSGNAQSSAATGPAIASEPAVKDNEPEKEPEPELPPEPTTAAISLRCAGDIMGHMSQINSAYVKETDSYDFKPVFSLIKPYMQDCDICMANIETTFKGTPPWQGYPGFNSPDELLYDVVDTGIKVALLSNNHMFDTRIDGLMRGLQMFREAGVLTAGAQQDGEENYTIIEINGVKLGIVAYTYETSMYNGLHTVNGIAIPADDYDNMNGFGYQNYDSDLAKMKDTIDRCKAAGAQVIVAYMHWGEEYQNSANNWQKRIAQDLAENGADMIIASHPHVVQEISQIDVAYNGHLKTVPVFYSIGNFVSNQRQETLSNKYTENGLLACVDFVYSFEDERIIDIKYGAIPTWVERYTKNGTYQYYIVPLTEGFEESEILAESGHLNRAKQALEDLKTIVGGEEHLWLDSVSR